MIYFNTLNGKQGRAIADVEAGLADLMVIKGSLGSLKDANGVLQWDEQLWSDLHDATNEGGVNFLGTIKLKFGNQANFEGESPEFLKRLWSSMLERFMTQNGQLPYIKGQQWYTSQLAMVDISVNFYHNRSAADRTFEFHKDTAGDNLFVNLIFNNKKPILATEWTVDRRKMKQKKKDRMTTFVGDASMATEIEKARTDIRKGDYKPKGVSRIEGGVAKGGAAFVSWVDELVWHSSPFAGKRADSKRLQIYTKPEKYVWKEAGQDAYDYSLIVKALQTLRRIPGTLVNKYGKRSGDNWQQQIDAYLELIVDDDGNETSHWDKHLRDLRNHMPGLVKYGPKKYVFSQTMPKQDADDFNAICDGLRGLRLISGTLINSYATPSGGSLFEQLTDYIQTIVDYRGMPTSKWAEHLNDIRTHWAQIIIGHGEEQASDISNDYEDISRLTKISARERRNSKIFAAGWDTTVTSDVRQLAKLESYRLASETTEKRSFIRTWVQIHKV